MKLKNIYPICVSLREANLIRLVSLIKKFPFVEIRFDARKFSLTEVKSVLKKAPVCIATCRSGIYSEKQRQELLLSAIEHGADFVDLEIEAGADFKKSLIAQARKKKVKSIISLHDFKKTADFTTLNRAVNKAKREGADVVKIATLVKEEKDINVLVRLLTRHKNLVVIGMGSRGRSLRLAAPLVGGLFTFAAALKGKETAPGQMTFAELKNIYSKLGLLGQIK